MSTDWLFWLYVSSGIFGLLIVYGATAKRNLRSKPLDGRLGTILGGISATMVSLETALILSGRFPFDNVVKRILVAISIVLLVTVIGAVVEQETTRELSPRKMCRISKGQTRKTDAHNAR
jgi:uncharacterized membrane protein